MGMVALVCVLYVLLPMMDALRFLSVIGEVCLDIATAVRGSFYGYSHLTAFQKMSTTPLYYLADRQGFPMYQDDTKVIMLVDLQNCCGIYAFVFFGFYSPIPRFLFTI